MQHYHSASPPTGDPSIPEVVFKPPPEYIYTPNYCQYFFPHLNINRERNVGDLVATKFTKDHLHTILRVTWEGNINKKVCTNCCAQWQIRIDGSECSNFEDIETSITSSSAQDVFAPTTITGYCLESGGVPINAGTHLLKLVVGGCGNTFYNTATGFFSTSRLIVEEIPTCKHVKLSSVCLHAMYVV